LYAIYTDNRGGENENFRGLWQVLLFCQLFRHFELWAAVSMKSLCAAHNLNFLLFRKPLTASTIRLLKKNWGKLLRNFSSTMSTKKGNNSKKGQRHQNTKAFKNDLHDTSKKTKQINRLVVGGVCARCREIIEWRKKFKKYKPLAAPRKWYIIFSAILDF